MFASKLGGRAAPNDSNQNVNPNPNYIPAEDDDLANQQMRLYLETEERVARAARDPETRRIREEQRRIREERFRIEIAREDAEYERQQAERELQEFNNLVDKITAVNDDIITRIKNCENYINRCIELAHIVDEIIIKDRTLTLQDNYDKELSNTYLTSILIHKKELNDIFRLLYSNIKIIVDLIKKEIRFIENQLQNLRSKIDDRYFTNNEYMISILDKIISYLKTNIENIKKFKIILAESHKNPRYENILYFNMIISLINRDIQQEILKLEGFEEKLIEIKRDNQNPVGGGLYINYTIIILIICVLLFIMYILYNSKLYERYKVIIQISCFMLFAVTTYTIFKKYNKFI